MELGGSCHKSYISTDTEAKNSNEFFIAMESQVYSQSSYAMSTPLNKA